MRNRWLTLSSTLNLGNWRQLPGRLTQIDTGVTRGLWGTAKDGRIWRLNRNGKGWSPVSGRLTQVSVGQSGVWGVTQKGIIFYRIGTLHR